MAKQSQDDHEGQRDWTRCQSLGHGSRVPSEWATCRVWGWQGGLRPPQPRLAPQASLELCVNSSVMCGGCFLCVL